MADNKPAPDTKERFTTTLDGNLLQKIKILAIYEKCPANILIEQAIIDLLKKYESKKKRDKTNQASLFKNEYHDPLFEDD